eukprot:scaffold755_cov122-Isochrysis_galbana.AAC.3
MSSVLAHIASKMEGRMRIARFWPEQSKPAIAAIARDVDDGSGRVVGGPNALPAGGIADGRAERNPTDVPVSVRVARPFNEGGHSCPGREDTIIGLAVHHRGAGCGRRGALHITYADLRLDEPVDAARVVHGPDGRHAVRGGQQHRRRDHRAAAPTAGSVASAPQSRPGPVQVVRI